MNHSVYRISTSTLILIFFGTALMAQKPNYKPVPRDTTFTPYMAWIKIKKEFPQAEIVKPNLPSTVKAKYNQVFLRVNDSIYGKRELAMDVFQPKKKGKYPALVLVFGGGWRSGNRSMQIPMAQQIAARGYFTAVVDYRLSMEALYPTGVSDIKNAIRYLRKKASKYNIDANKMAITGSSAGGQLAALIGLSGDDTRFDIENPYPGTSVKVQAIIDMDGVLDFTDPNESAKDSNPAKPSAGAMWFGATYQQAPEKWIEASPKQYTSRNSPPILFINSALPRFHAGRDEVISDLNKYGIYSEVHTIENTPHPFWLFHPWFEPTVGFMVNFLDRVLKK